MIFYELNKLCNNICLIMETSFCYLQIACKNGKWGENCNKTCYNCINNSCDIVNGSCVNGCLGFDNPPDCDKGKMMLNK